MLLAVTDRSGLTETYHNGVFAVVDPKGNVVASGGEVERPFYLRSSAKPFQALSAIESGADLTPLELAMGASSHSGEPVHVGVAKQILSKAGLDSSDLRCPPDWPLSETVRLRVANDGHMQPRRIWHNCSGKHAAWLSACVANDWPTATYLEPSHPLQQLVINTVTELSGYSAEPVGVDGCGAPVLRTNATAMARLFSVLGNSDRLERVFAAMHQYPAMVSGSTYGDAMIAIGLNAAAKRGAAGCVAVALKDGYGLGVKSWDGSEAVATVAAVAILDQLALIPSGARSHFESWRSRPILGGGIEIGSLRAKVVV